MCTRLLNGLGTPLRLVFVGALLASGAAAQSATPLLAPVITFPVGDGPRAAVAGDFDEDGLPDLLTTDSLADQATVRLSLGDGHFLAAPVVPVEDFPLSAAVGDLDEDGHLDAAVSNFNSKSISILIGRGNGQFDPITPVSSGSGGAEALAIADLDVDGHLDLALATDSGLRTWLGLGDGHFTASKNFKLPAAPSDISLGSTNGDGLPDAAVEIEGANSNLILAGTGDGSFVQQTVVHVGVAGLRAKLTDLTGDGLSDLVVAHEFVFPLLEVYLGKSDGSFAGALGFIMPGPLADVAAGDIDADGQVDLVAAPQSGDGPLVLVNLSHGDFETTGPYGDISSNFALALADFNGDGRLDVATARQADDSVSILLNQHGTWTDLGSGLAGAGGVPLLSGTGLLEPGSSGALTLGAAAPAAPALLFIALSSTPVGFKCGTLLPFPAVLLIALPTDAQGSLSLPWDWPAGASGATLWFQIAVHDATAACGATLSNALKASVP